MRKTLTVALALGLIGATLGFYAVSSAADESGRTIRLLQRVTSLTFVDNGDKGDGPGDQEVFAGDLFKLEKGNKPGKRLGRSGVVVTVVSIDQKTNDAEALGVATYVFPEGKITGQTLVKFSENVFTAAITGGTGKFRNARGEVELRDIPDSENDGIAIIRLS